MLCVLLLPHHCCCCRRCSWSAVCWASAGPALMRPPGRWWQCLPAGAGRQQRTVSCGWAWSGVFVGVEGRGQSQRVCQVWHAEKGRCAVCLLILCTLHRPSAPHCAAHVAVCLTLLYVAYRFTGALTPLDVVTACISMQLLPTWSPAKIKKRFSNLICECWLQGWAGVGRLQLRMFLGGVFLGGPAGRQHSFLQQCCKGVALLYV